MLLRVSGETSGHDYDVLSISSAGTPSGVEHGEVLSRFAESVLGDDDRALEAERAALQNTLGAEAVVDAAAVIATFSKMDRIADATGIPLDGPLALMTEDLREEIGVVHFASAENTPDASQTRRLFGRGLEKLIPRLITPINAMRRRLTRDSGK